MEIDTKYALLDTDFLYKTHLAKNKDNLTSTRRSTCTAGI